MSAEDYHLIEKYLNNNLTEAEQKDFELKMQDADFADTVRVYTEVNESLQAKEKRKEGEEHLKHTLKTVSEEFFATSKKKGKVVPLRNIYWATAACIILALSFLFILNWSSDAPEYSNYAHYEPLALSSRSDNQSLTIAAEETFNNGKYAEAAALLEQLSETDPDNPRLKVYLALSYIETENYTQAEHLLAEVQQGTSIFQSTASWYLALSFLKQGNEKACKKQLSKIQEGSPYFEESRALLEEL
ncbi:tetratricopeptide repeat protein [Fulvivirga ulvae]|uniref:tetratricopeptide repeat protein n=1 Tax=Fulvivirga ulvae TaxID=2904245 RepID=UPI001F1AE764|nr:tetratricopeptide repeat protein [Fulvivirga ulvae]UII33188.1 tetratricopeptide repeat protein [Fulvivirga ulvae]